MNPVLARPTVRTSRFVVGVLTNKANRGDGDYPRSGASSLAPGSIFFAAGRLPVSPLIGDVIRIVWSSSFLSRSLTTGGLSQMAYLTLVRTSRKVPLLEQEETVGRASTSRVHLDDRTVSRNHALFLRDGDDWRIKDLGSTRGSFVNDERIESERELNDGDIVRFGSVELTFHSGPTVVAASARPSREGYDDNGGPELPTETWTENKEKAGPVPKPASEPALEIFASPEPRTGESADETRELNMKKGRARPSLSLALGCLLIASLASNCYLAWRLAEPGHSASPSTGGVPSPEPSYPVNPSTRPSSISSTVRPETEQTTHRITVTVWADTKSGSPKYAAQYQLYRNGQEVRNEMEDSSYIEFKNVEVKEGDKLSGKVGWRNGFGAVLRTDKSDEATVSGGDDVSIHTDQYKY